MANARSMLKGLIGFSVVPIATAFITVFVIPVVSNVFPAEEYGKINLFYSIGALLTTLFMLGLDNSFIRYYFDPPKGMSRGSIQSIALGVGLVVTILATVMAICFFSEPVSVYLFGEFHPWLIIVLGVYVATLILFRLLNTDARMQENHRRYNVQSIAQALITRIAFVFVAVFSTYYAYSVVAITIGMLVLSLVFAFFQRDSFSHLNGNVSQKSLSILFSFGIPVMMTNFVLNLNGMIGRLMLSGAGMYEAVGIFAIATTLSNAFSVIPAAFSTYWSPFMYKNYQTEQNAISKVHDLVMLASGVIVALIIMMQDVLFVLVGHEYAVCQAYFMIIMLNPIQALICETTSYGIVLKERPVYNAISSVIGVVVSAVVTFILLDELGVLAAALGVAASALITGVLRTMVGQHYYKSVALPIKTLVSSCLIIAACFANSILYKSFISEVIAGVFLLAFFVTIYSRQVRDAITTFRRTR